MTTFQTFREKLEKVRETDFSRLAGTVYLDQAGAGQYPTRLLHRYLEDLSTNVYSNPHSGSPSAERVEHLMENVRCQVLQFFNTTPDEYTVIFTSGCTASLKLLAGSFDFTSIDQDDCANSRGNSADTTGGFCFLKDNHTSVVGMREVAFERGASVRCLTEKELKSYLNEDYTDSFGIRNKDRGNWLFAFPAQSNFCGRRYPLNWIRAIHQKGGDNNRNYVLLDAASFVTTSQLNLTEHKPDFVSISFYKMFGFPTGLGALLVRNDSSHVLRKSYFGGGTVKVALPEERFQVHRDSLSERFEDGTVNYLDILALRHALGTFYEIIGEVNNVSEYTFLLSKLLFQYLKNCRHGNGTPVAIVYCDTNYEVASEQGPIVTFNILRSSGEHMGFSEVSKLAQLYNIHLRTGCFCNLGGCQQHLDLSNEHTRKNFQEGHVCGDDVDLVDGLPTGAVRISPGYFTTVADICSFIFFVEECLVEGHKGMDIEMIKAYTESILARFTSGESDITKQPNNEMNTTKDEKPLEVIPITNHRPETQQREIPQISSVHIQEIRVYPVKSCGAFVTSSWMIGPMGLLYDRAWMVVDSAGINLTQKKCPSLVHIEPHIDLDEGILTLSFPGMESVSLPLQPTAADTCRTSQMTCTSRICRDTIQGHVCNQEVSRWLEDALGSPGLQLVRQDPNQVRTTKRQPLAGSSGSAISLANESQYLLISERSVVKFNATMIEQAIKDGVDPNEVPDVLNLTARFRANLIISGNIDPYEEETWRRVHIGGNTFNVQGGCKRCQVICTDQQTGEKRKEVFRALSAVTERKLTFGILMNNAHSEGVKNISVGNVVKGEDRV